MDTILGMIWLFAMLHIPYALVSDRLLERRMYRKLPEGDELGDLIALVKADEAAAAAAGGGVPMVGAEWRRRLTRRTR